MDLGDLVWRVGEELDPRRQIDRLRAPGRTLRDAVAGRRVLLTGASAGIGRETALMLGGAGAELILVARRGALLKDLAERVERRGGAAHPYACDLTDDDQVDTLVSYATEGLGGVDVLINNAGHSIRRNLDETTGRLHDAERLMRLNYFGALRLTVPIVAHMRTRRRGHVVNVSTLGVQVGAQPLFAGYLASKAALDAFARSAAPETRRDGVVWTTVHMPLVRTEMIEPTGVYRALPAMTPRSGARMIAHAVVHRPARVSHPAGTAGHLLDLLVPEAVERVMGRAAKITGGL
ncbi:SDR family NAD(P)-dependent oxidoreductase [Actinomadura kijaniata]|uniref:SDR family NAD(P)-dependent oxidoreductase n=1 Tax=Actinomadura kijaniata TaxID=46161 RepID=UPI0008359CAD|nr:SDR family NAD(P)-dependent oxidoreductase [Actinomadura kijaniata]